MMLAGIPVPASATAELSDLLGTAGHDQLADRLKRALDDETRLLALSIEERIRILSVLDDPSNDLAELRGVLINEVEWRRREGLD